MVETSDLSNKTVSNSHKVIQQLLNELIDRVVNIFINTEISSPEDVIEAESSFIVMDEMRPIKAHSVNADTLHEEKIELNYLLLMLNQLNIWLTKKM